MSEQQLDGRHYLEMMVEVLKKVNAKLPDLASQVDATQIPVWQEKMMALVEAAPSAAARIFPRTVAGIELGKLAWEQVQALQRVVEEGIATLPQPEATKALGDAVEAVDKDLGLFIHKAKTIQIRMT